MPSWILLTLAIVFEVAGTTCMKLSDGLTRVWPVVGIVMCYLASFVGLALALRHLDVSVTYAVWAGLGIVLITLVGIFFFKEPMTFWRVACIALILMGVIGLNLSSP